MWRARFRVSQRNGNRGQLLNCANNVPCNQDAVVWMHLRRTYANSLDDTSPFSRTFPPPFRPRTSVRDRTGAFLRTANLKEHQRCDKGPALLIIRRASYGMSLQKK